MKFLTIRVTDRPLTIPAGVAMKLDEKQAKGRRLEKRGKGRGVHFVSAKAEQFKVGQEIAIDAEKVTKSMTRADIYAATQEHKEAKTGSDTEGAGEGTEDGDNAE